MTVTISTSSSAGMAMPANVVSRAFRDILAPPGCNGRLHGLYELNGHRLYVNRGFAGPRFPSRWNSEPELLVIEWTAC